MVVGGAEPDELAAAGLAGVVEILLVPDGAFVEEELRALGVPIAGDRKLAGGIEVVLHQVAGGGGFFVGAHSAVGIRPVAIVEIPGLVRVNDGPPRIR